MLDQKWVCFDCLIFLDKQKNFIFDCRCSKSRFKMFFGLPIKTHLVQICILIFGPENLISTVLEECLDCLLDLKLLLDQSEIQSKNGTCSTFKVETKVEHFDSGHSAGRVCI